MNDYCDDEDVNSILKIFHDYKQFCFDKINDLNSSNDEKILFMNKIIQNLFDQNEQLIRLIIETKQNCKIKSIEIHRFMLETAAKTIDIGQALTSYELEMKNLTEQKLPDYLNVIEALEQQSSCLDNLKNVNEELQQENQLLNNEIDKKNIELLQYKRIVCNMMDDECSNSNHRFTTDSKSSLTEIFIETKLNEQETAMDSMICASIIDELIDAIVNDDEEQYEQLSNVDQDQLKLMCNSTSTTSLTDSTIDQWFEWHSDESEIEFEDAWCNVLTEINNNHYNSLMPIKIDNYRYLSLISLMLNELRYKNTVINEMKNLFHSNRKKFIELHYRFIERGLQMLKFLINLIQSNLENDQDADDDNDNEKDKKKSSSSSNQNKMIQTMAMNIENEIKEIVHYEDFSTITI